MTDRQTKAKTALFDYGRIVATMGAVRAFREADGGPSLIALLLGRHVTGDWGDVTDDDKASNDAAVKDNTRILSAYKLDSGEKIWIITEADRSATTLLLPEEY